MGAGLLQRDCCSGSVVGFVQTGGHLTSLILMPEVNESKGQK